MKHNYSIRKLLLVAVVALALVGCTGSSKKQAKQVEEPTISEETTEVAEDIEDETPSVDETFIEVLEMKGNIGEYPITMNFIWRSDCGDAGSYHYDSRPNSNFTLKYESIELVDTDYLTFREQHAVVNEYTAAGNHTGTFDGTIYNQAGRYTTFDGTFTNAQGEQFEFSVANYDNGEDDPWTEW